MDYNSCIAELVDIHSLCVSSPSIKSSWYVWQEYWKMMNIWSADQRAPSAQRFNIPTLHWYNFRDWKLSCHFDQPEKNSKENCCWSAAEVFEVVSAEVLTKHQHTADIFCTIHRKLKVFSTWKYFARCTKLCEERYSSSLDVAPSTSADLETSWNNNFWHVL